MSETKEIKLSILLSIIIIIGLFGNVINLIVFSHRSIKNNSTFKYLFYLALIDIFVLLIAGTDSLATYGHYFFIRLSSIFFCKIHTFLTYFLTHLSSMVLMVVSIDRAIIICEKKSTREETFGSMSTIANLNSNIGALFKNVSFVIFLLIFLLTCVDIHFILFLDLNISDLLTNEIELVEFSNESLINDNGSFQSLMCFPLRDEKYNYFLTNIWNWIDTLIYSLIPFVVMSICAIIIIVEIKTKSKGFIKTCQTKNKAKSNKKICFKSKRRNQKLSLMLLINNIFFILCSLPLCLNTIYYNYKGENAETHSFRAYFHILAFSYNSFNFIFYYILSSKYQEVISLVFFRRKHQFFTTSSQQPKTNIILRTNAFSCLNRNTNSNRNISSLNSQNKKSTNLTFLKDFTVMFKANDINDELEL